MDLLSISFLFFYQKFMNYFTLVRAWFVIIFLNKYIHYTKNKLLIIIDPM